MTDFAATSDSLPTPTPTPTPTPAPSADWRQRLPDVLAGLRVAFGLALMVAPSFAAAPFLGAEARRPSVRFTNRLFGVRDAALGVAVLSARRRGRDDDVTRALWLSAACDAFDATAALRRRELSWWGRLLVGTTALAAAGLGVLAALTPGEQ